MKVAFVTGAGSGMGQLYARRALAEGWAVAAADINTAGLDRLPASERLLKLAMDITDAAAVNAAVERTERELGPIHRLVNAAAIMPLGRILDQEAATIHRIMAINYGGLVNITKAALPAMIARRAGEFVSFSSLAGHMPTVYVGAYNASKFAVTAFTEVLYQENRDSGVKFVCVCPPAVATPLLEQGRETVWPKLFDVMPPIAPETVLDCIDQALAAGRFWVFPSAAARVVYVLRRFFPVFTWWRVRRIEGL
jgi:NAD(P)-dependent dehydrogenase (short-subunit alcohol dehydrogenase family)